MPDALLSGPAPKLRPKVGVIQRYVLAEIAIL